MTRTQALVLGFFLLAWVSLAVILAAAPETYDHVLRLPAGSRAAELGFLGVLTGFLVLLGVGVLRRWRWAFWVILVAFLAGILRVPVAGLQLLGVLTADGPSWYILVQALLGVMQLVIGLAMLVGYRRGGPWAAF
jgi:hypothetical protein